MYKRKNNTHSLSQRKPIFSLFLSVFLASERIKRKCILLKKLKKKKGSEWLPYVNYLHTAQDDEIFYQLKYMTGDYVLKRNKQWFRFDLVFENHFDFSFVVKRNYKRKESWRDWAWNEKKKVYFSSTTPPPCAVGCAKSPAALVCTIFLGKMEG